MVRESIYPPDLALLSLSLTGALLIGFVLHPGLSPYLGGFVDAFLKVGLAFMSVGLAAFASTYVLTRCCDRWLRRVYVVEGDELIVRHCLFKWPLGGGRGVNPHELFVGGSGAGKSNALKVRLGRLIEDDRLSIAVFDWCGEYSFLRGWGFKVLDLSRECFDVFSCDVSDVVEAANLAFPGMADVQRSLLFQHASAASSFAELNWDLERRSRVEDVSNVRGAAIALLQRLRLLEDAFGEPRLSVEELFSGRVVLDFSRVRTEEARVFLAELVLRMCYKWAMQRSPLRLCLVIDEAHRLLSRVEALQGRVEPILNRFMREVRKLGVIVLAATQCLTDLPNPCIANFGKIYVMAGAGPEDLKYLSYVNRAYVHVAQGLQVGEAFEFKGDGHAALKIKVFKWRRFKEARRELKELKANEAEPNNIPVEEVRCESVVEVQGGGLTEREEQVLNVLRSMGLEDALIAFKAGRPIPRHCLNRLIELGLVKPFRGGVRLTKLGEKLVTVIESIEVNHVKDV